MRRHTHGAPGAVRGLIALLVLSALLTGGCGGSDAQTPPRPPAPDAPTQAPSELEPSPAQARQPQGGHERPEADDAQQGDARLKDARGEQVRPVSPVELDWPAPTPADRWAQCPFTSRVYDPNNTLVAVVVENSAKARPQSGLVEADVVYEALAEGGITRFLALFHCSSCRKIGPVRSIRPYFAVIAREWGAPVAHCGGDAKDIEPVRDLRLVDVDELRDGRGFWRDNTRAMPHNLYVTANNVRSRARETAARSPVVPVSSPPWTIGRWQEAPAAGIEIEYGPGYTVRYDRADGGYRRYMNGEIHKDRETGRAIVAANVIVQFAESRVAYEDLGLVIDLVGRGKAMFLTAGKLQDGVWEKASTGSPTRFATLEGKAIECAPGQTWIQIVPSGAVVKAG